LQNPGPEAAAAAPAAKPRRNRARVVFPALLVIAAVVGGTVWLLGRGRESTDDAQVEGRVINVSARVAGQVARVLVQDNQLVEAGAPLVELDDRDLSARLDAAKADQAAAQAALDAAKTNLAITERNAPAALDQARGGVTQAKAGMTSSKAVLEQARAALTAARAKERHSALELERVKKLRAENSATQAELDEAESTHDQDAAELSRSEASLLAAQAATQGSSGGMTAAEAKLQAAQTIEQQVEAARATVAAAEARVAQAAAAVKLAELNLSYTKVAAPVRGVVSRRAVEAGQMVSPERPLLALVPPDDVWVVANYKEDQIAEMKAGQPATVKVDTYGGREFAGHVDSLAGASGARFSLLPPDNASGNFVKVVQRIPVLIRLDGPPAVPLRPGMSAVVTVRTDAK
jgi:membrane fusion protein (multidrug efflux system)